MLSPSEFKRRSDWDILVEEAYYSAENFHMMQLSDEKKLYLLKYCNVLRTVLQFIFTYQLGLICFLCEHDFMFYVTLCLIFIFDSTLIALYCSVMCKSNK